VIGELSLGVEHIEIRRARGVIGTRHVLGLIEQKWELPAFLPGQSSHVLGAVLGVGHDAVGIDGCHRETEIERLVRHLDELAANMHDKGAVIADEHHQHPLRTLEPPGAHRLIRHRVGQDKSRQRCTEGQKSG